MANPIAEAFVQVRPDMTVFGPQLQAGINQALRNLKLPTNVQNQVGGQLFGPGFQQQIQTSTTQGIANTKVPATTQRNLAQNLFGSAFRTESGRALQGALVGLGGGELAAQAAFFGPGGAAIAALGAGLIVASKSAITFEQSMEILRTTTQASEEDLQRAGDAAQELGERLDLPGVTAQSAAQAITELAKAGLTLEDSIAGAEGTLRLAIAAQIDTGTAAQIAAAGLNSFNLAGTDASHVADLLAGASIAAQGDIGDMALALQQSAAVASQAGLSIEQLVGLITALARQGILGSDAGTSIRTMLLRLVPTTKEAAAEMERLGVQLDQTRTIGEQLPEVIEQYRRGLSILTPIQRQAALQQIFGTDAIRSATVAFSQGAQGIQAATDAANRQGAAADLAAARSRGAAGALADLKSEGQTFALTIGNLMLPAITELIEDLVILADVANDTIGVIDDLAHLDLGPFGSVAEIMGDIVAKAAPGARPLVLFGAAVRELRDQIKGTEDDLDGTAAGFEDLSHRVVGAITSLQSALGAPAQTLRIAESLGLTPRELDRIFGTIRQDGLEAGFNLGKALMDGTAAGITQSEQRAIDAARRSLSDIQREGEQRVLESIRSARANLESLGDSISSAFEEIIDAGPVGQAIDELNEKLDALEDRVSRQRLRFDFHQAEADLRNAQESIEQFGILTPRQKREQQEFLAPLRQKVKDAKTDIKKFDLTEAIDKQEELRDAAVDAAENGIQVLIDKFEDGKISAAEFSRLLNNQLAPALDTIQRENLGLSFERGFLRDVKTLVAQVKELSPFIGTPGTTPGPQVISPSATQAEVNRSIAQAQLNLSQAIQDANKLTKEELEKHDREIAVLRRILDALTPGDSRFPGGARGQGGRGGD